MKSFFLIAFAIVLQWACAGSGYEIVEHNDRVESIKRTYMAGNKLGSKSGENGYEFYLNALRYDWRTGEILYYLVVRYNAENWLQIPRGKSLILTIDGQKVSLWGEGSAEDRNIFQDDFGQEYHSERAWFQVTPKQLKRLAGGRRVSVQLRGEKGILNDNCSRLNLARFREFVRKYVGK